MLDQALKTTMSAIPSCIAVGAVDLTTGTLLALHAEQERSQEMLNVMTTTITELFEAPLLQAFSEIYAPEGEDGGGAARQFTELLLMNGHHNYLLLRGRKRAQFAMVVITRKETSAGMLMMKAMALLPDVEKAF